MNQSSQVDYTSQQRYYNTYLRPRIAPRITRSNSYYLSTEYKNMFLSQVKEYMDENLSNPDISTITMAKHLCMSRSQLYRKMKKITGESPNQYLRNYRLDLAMNMLRERKGNVTEVAMTVGISDPKYFSRRFSQRFGYPPSRVVRMRVR